MPKTAYRPAFVLFLALLTIPMACTVLTPGANKSPPTTAQSVENQIADAELIFGGAQIAIGFAHLDPVQRGEVNNLVASARKSLDKVEADARAGRLADVTTITYVALQLGKDYADYRAAHP